MESILISIKKVLGIDAEYTHFDADIIMHINTTLFTLNQIGAGPEEPFVISDDSATWSDFFGDRTDLEIVKSYVGLKVRSLFDPPTNGPSIEALERTITQLEWRIYSASNFNKEEGEDEREQLHCTLC